MAVKVFESMDWQITEITRHRYVDPPKCRFTEMSIRRKYRILKISKIHRFIEIHRFTQIYRLTENSPIYRKFTDLPKIHRFTENSPIQRKFINLPKTHRFTENSPIVSKTGLSSVASISDTPSSFTVNNNTTLGITIWLRLVLTPTCICNRILISPSPFNRIRI